MSNKARLFIASNNQDLTSCIRGSLSKRASIESIISILRPSDIQNKLNPYDINILIWDLTFIRHDTAFVNAIRNSYNLHVIYTSYESNAIPLLSSGNLDCFASKPAIFTTATAQRYTATIERHIDSFLGDKRPLSMRELMKTTSVGDKQKIVTIASSTGGTNALEDIIKFLPADCPPIAIVQHMPSGFTKLLAERLNSIYRQNIREAENGDYLMRGTILLAPADKHMKIIKKNGKFAVDCFVGNRLHGVMPAADILFESVAEHIKANAIGVVLTGMGNDGAKGLRLMRAAGSKNIGQNQATCVVYGMPKAAKDIGAIDYELPLSKIAEKIIELTKL